MRPARLFCGNALLYQAAMAGFIAADLLLVRLFGQSSIFFVYVNMFQYLLIMMHVICITTICRVYAQLALGLGATRRQLVRGYTVVTFFSAGLATLLSLCAVAVTPLVLGAIAGDTIQAAMGAALADGGIWFALVPMLGSGAAFGWMAILKNRKGWRSMALILVVIVTAVALCLVLPMVVLMLTDGNVPGTWIFDVLNTLRWAILAGGLVLFAVFYGLTVRELRRLTR